MATATPTGNFLQRHRTLALLSLTLLVLLLFIFFEQTGRLGDAPTPWEIPMRDRVDDFRSWTVLNRATHPLFTWFFDPISDFINDILSLVEDVLLWLPWVVIVAAVYLLALRAAGQKIAILCTASLLYMGLVGLWDESMETLALMVVSVVISLSIGIPLGILASFNDRFEAAIRPFLDFMQTVPAFVYLIPILLFFSVGPVAGVIPTVIYAMPPAIRLTNLGIRQVEPESVEAARSFGSTPLQTLYKVQLPLALPSIMMGVNQTIMMALGIVVIASLVGAGGLGDAVLKPMQRIQVGRALEAGLAIVFMAVVLDRISFGFGKRDYGSLPQKSKRMRILPAAVERSRFVQAAKNSRDNIVGPARPLAFLLGGAAIVLALVAVNSLVVDLREFPQAWHVQLNQPVDAVVVWMRDNLFQIGDLPIGTGPFSDFVVIRLLNPLRSLLTDVLPWAAIMMAVAAVAWLAAGWRLAFVSVAGLAFIGLMGMWDKSMDTLSQVIVAVVITIVIAIPLGILASRNDTFEALLRPILDFLQAIPPFVYLVPVIMLFNIGRVPGIMASVLYALPPAIRLTNLGIRQVDSETVEAATALGSTSSQTLVKVQLPLAMPTIMMGVNQTIMMVLAMVIIAGLVGGGALGLEAVEGLARAGQKGDLGEGLQAGLAIGIMAIILDRITQSWAKKQEAAGLR
jgi:glycine betaine/proline transport system permease protein